MKIYHPIKQREIEVENIKIGSHIVRTEAIINDDDADNFVESYKEEVQTYVEFTVIGANREYQDHMLLDDFRKHNPHVHVE